MLAWFDLLRGEPEFDLKILCAAEGWFTEELKSRNLAYEILPMPSALRKIRHGQWRHRLATAWSVLTMAGGLLRAWSQVAVARADIVVLTGGRDFIMLLPLVLRRRRRTVTIPQTTDWGEIPTCRLMCRLAGRTYAISEAVAESIVRMGIPRARVGVEPLIYTADYATQGYVTSEIRRELGLPLTGPILGMTGIVRPHKGQREAVLVLEQVLQKVPEAHLVIIGRPPADAPDAQEYFGQVKELVASRNLQERVIFLGWRGDVSRVMRAMDVMLVPSHDFEGVPRVILEALEAGLPIVATDLPQFREILASLAVRCLHPIDQLSDWADSIVRLLTSVHLKAAMSKDARALWVREYSSSSVRPRITAAFRRIVQPERT